MKYDVVIIGGGVIGSSIAFHLAEESRLSVLVIERDPSYARASSALSASSIRQQFTTPVCMAMSRFSFDFLKRARETLAVGDDRPEIGLVERGYLYLAAENRTAQLEAAIDIQRKNDVPLAEMTPSELGERFPWLNVRDLGLGVLGTAGEGWFDGYSLMQAFRVKARSLGVTYLHDEVIGLIVDGDRVCAVETSGAGRIDGQWIVDAAGPHAGRVAAMIGAKIPIKPEKRTIFAFRCAEQLPGIPLVVDPSGFYVRPEGDGYIAGGPALRPDDEELEPDYDQFDDFIWPMLAHRVPAFERIKMTRAWAGYYEMNTYDHNGVIGAVPNVAGLLVAAGFSGHGMQHSPATGRGVAELILHGRYTSLDLSSLSPERLVGRLSRGRIEHHLVGLAPRAEGRDIRLDLKGRKNDNQAPRFKCAIEPSREAWRNPLPFWSGRPGQRRNGTGKGCFRADRRSACAGRNR